MTVKKILCILLAISLLLAFASCNKSEDSENDTTIAENTTETTEKTDTDTTEKDLIPEPYYPSRKEIDKNSIYYNASQEDFRITYEGDDEVLSLVDRFCTVNYLGMGTTYRAISYVLSFMTLAQMPESSWQTIPEFLDTLTDVQLDYMSYCVFNCFNTSQLIIERDTLTMEYVLGVTEDADIYAQCTDMQAFRLAQFMFNQFDERGVRYDWTVYDTEYLFVN